MKKLNNLMRIGRFFGAGETISGHGALAGLSRMPVWRVSVIVSHSVWAGHEPYITKCFDRFATDVIIGPRTEPTVADAYSLSARFRNHSPDVIVAIGGGSVIDAAKIGWVHYEKSELALTTGRKVTPITGLRSNVLGFVAVPTTYGSGSESSSAAVYQDGSYGEKCFVVGLDLLPDIAVLDPKLATNLPHSVAANGVMDAITHLIEGYVSKATTPQVQVVAAGALSNLRNLLNNSSFNTLINTTAHVEKMMSSSILAGIVQNISNPGLAHSLSHYCSRFGVPHGQACGHFLPLSIRYNSQNSTISAMYHELARASGFEDGGHLIDWVERLADEFDLGQGIPSSSELFCDMDRERFFSDPTASMNPVIIDIDRLVDFMDVSK